MKEYLATLLVGLNKTEQVVVLTLLYLDSQKQYGEVPGRNLRTLLDVSKEQLFLELEKLVQKNILKFSNDIVENRVYLSAGKGYYVFNENYREWLPVAESLFYKICKLVGYGYNKHSYLIILNEIDLRKELNKDPEIKDTKITPYELFDLFCQWHLKIFGREYVPPNQAKDLQTLKKIIFDMSFDGFNENAIKEFLKWSFLSKAKTFNSSFIVGFLPLCLKDYLTTVKTSPINKGYIKDEDGRLRKI